MTYSIHLPHESESTVVILLSGWDHFSDCQVAPADAIADEEELKEAPVSELQMWSHRCSQRVVLPDHFRDGCKFTLLEQNGWELLTPRNVIFGGKWKALIQFGKRARVQVYGRGKPQVYQYPMLPPPLPPHNSELSLLTAENK